MGVLDKLGTAYLRRSTQKSADRFLALPHIAEQFADTRTQIGDVLADTQYHHGTGRLHYGLNGHSKYCGTVEKPEDTLDSLLIDGLRPQEDLFSEQFVNGDIPTISLTQRRMYARVYATLFREEGTVPSFEYGSQAFWWKCFFWKMLMEALKDKAEWHRQINSMKLYWKRDPELMAKRKKFIERLKLWMSTFRNDDKFKNKAHRLLTNGSSTIEGNYPLIVGIRYDVVQALPIDSKCVSAFETRTDQSIVPADWSCIEAPLDRIEEVRSSIQAHGYSIPVIPLEFVELLMREKPLSELTAPN